MELVSLDCDQMIENQLCFGYNLFEKADLKLDGLLLFFLLFSACSDMSCGIM